MHAVLADHALGHQFIQGNVSDDPSDHRPFLVAVNAGGGVDILFEDMAGDPDADYDYNDRQWGDLPLGAPATRSTLWTPGPGRTSPPASR